MDDMNDPRILDLIDAQLQYLRGEGPKPELSDLTDADRDAVAGMLELVEAMADSLPPSPPIDEDPVAIRLGLVGQVSSNGLPAHEVDPVVESAQALAFRFNGAIAVDEATNLPLDGVEWRPVVLCRSLAEIVLVVALDPEGSWPTAADARPLFQESAELSAVAFTSPDATQAVVVTRSESAGRLIPAKGWEEATSLRWEPLDIALGRHLDRSIPRWEDVASLPSGELLEDLESEARSIVESELTRVAKTRPQLGHKRQARDFVAEIDAARFIAWLDAVRARRASGEEVASQISELCRAGNP